MVKLTRSPTTARRRSTTLRGPSHLVARLERVVPRLTILLGAPLVDGTNVTPGRRRPRKRQRRRGASRRSACPHSVVVVAPGRAARMATPSCSRRGQLAHAASRGRERRSPRPGAPDRPPGAARPDGCLDRRRHRRERAGRRCVSRGSRPLGADRRATAFAPWASVATRRGSTTTTQRDRRPWAPISRWASVPSRSQSVGTGSSRR